MRRLIVGLIAALLLPAASRAADQDFSALRAKMLHLLWEEQPWDALKVSDEAAAIPGLSAARRADILLHRAKLKMRVGDSKGAVQDLRDSLKARPGNARALLELARALQDKPEEALRSADAAARSSQARIKSQALVLAAELKLDLDDPKGAEERALRALKLDAGDLDALRVLVRIHRSEPAKAGELGEKAARIAAAAPSWYRSSALRFCADIWLEIPDRDRAADCLNAALAIAPDDLPLLQKLAEVRRAQMGMMGAASPVAAESLAGPADELTSLGEALKAEKGKLGEPAGRAASERFMDAVQDQPAWRRPDAFRVGTLVWAAAGDPAAARGCLERAHDLDWNMMAKLRMFDELARSSYTAVFPASEVETSEAEQQFSQAAALHKEVKDAAGAEAVTDRGLALLPGSVSLLRWKVELSMARGELAAARTYAQRLSKSAQAETPADFVARTRTKDFLRKYAALNQPGQPAADDRACIEIFLKKPGAMDEAVRAVDADRDLARRTLFQVGLAAAPR